MSMHRAASVSCLIFFALAGCSSPSGDATNGGGFTPAGDKTPGDPSSTTDAEPPGADGTPPSTTSPVTEGTLYQVKSVSSGKCFDVTDVSMADGANLQQWTCVATGKNQQFKFRSVGAGLYEITALHSGKCLSARGADDGSTVQQFACDGSDSQRFQLVDQGSGQFELVSASSSKCVDLADSSAADGAKMQEWACSGKDNQRFTFSTVTPPDPGPTDAGPSDAPVTPPKIGNFPDRFSAPYVATWNDNNLSNLSKGTGNNFWTLAFIIDGGGSCNPMWNGDTSLGGNSYGKYISELQKAGGDVIVSFGGASGTELGKACDSVDALQAAYQKVITQFHLTWIDLDIESGQESDAPSVDRRNKALHNLQVANPGLRVSYTLAVDRTGLPSAQRNLLANAKKNGVDVTVVNIMAMDYGPCYSDMGQAGVDAAKATNGQLSTLGLSAKVGVTPMIGTNDVSCEKFSTSDSHVLVDWAQTNSFIQLLAYWVQDSDPSHSYIDVFKTFH
ncbi:MAG: RICIN domain-containing protein [Polyangiales bacterium]